MVAAVTSVSTIAAVTAATPELSLQPGTVVDAKVIQLLKNDLVQIALQGVLIDALSEVPLQAGQNLKLAVSQTPQGIRLAVVPASDGLQSSSTHVSAAATTRPQVVTGSPPITAELEAQAVSVATQSAAPRQISLSQLFANLSVASESGVLPKAVQQAITQLVALQPPLAETIDGAQLKQAFQSSGLFREAALANASPGNTPPDLKSALIVLRQTLSIALADEPPATLPQPAVTIAPAPPKQPSPVVITNTGSLPADDAQQTTNVADEPVILPALIPTTIRAAAPTTPTLGANALIDLIVQTLQTGDGNTAAASQTSEPRMSEARFEIGRSTTPPPPFRGAAPSAQAVMPSTIAPDTPASTVVKQLLDDTDGAIARQTLLQIASLPDRADIPGAKLDAAQPRWAFEIPFATPQGTAVAQFEIAKDGGGNAEAGSAKRVWRARFTLDVEPAGPVHAIVSLAGETTSVRMWAERPLTAARLRAGTTELAQALQSAALQPGDIVIGEGAPPQAATAPAGHFIDRAS